MQLNQIRTQFPLIAQSTVAYLDSAATTQKPQAVIDRLVDFYDHENANVHRGLYDLSVGATQVYEEARSTIASFIGAHSPSSIVLSSGTTASINLVAQSFLKPRLQAGDNVVTTILEHHSNYLPWRMLCDRVGAQLRVVPVGSDGRLDLSAIASMIDEQTKVVAITHVSNVLGTISPLERIVEIAHAYGVPVLVDGAQAVAHLPVNVSDLDIDFYCFSGHKLYGPTGIGVLYGRSELLESMEPVVHGGEMVRSVGDDLINWQSPPHRFEAGTPNIAGAVGLAAAIDFVASVGVAAIRDHEQALTEYLIESLLTIDGVSTLGTDSVVNRTGVVSFAIESVHPHDLASIANESSVAIRAGLHCAEPLHRSLGFPASARASLGMYSNTDDIDRLAQAVRRSRQVLL